MYEVPLSSKTTALFDGAAGTVVETAIVCVPTINESKRTFQRVGAVTGHVGILFVLVTLAYEGSVSPTEKLPWTPSPSEVLWRENAMKLGSFELSLKRL